MSSDPQTPVDLSFGTAYDRLHQIAAELGANDALPPEQLIALLREGKGLERALRDHLDRVEQEVREIDEGDGAASFRISDGSRPGGTSPASASVPPSAPVVPSTPTRSAAPVPPVAPDPPAAPAAPAAPPAPVAPEPVRRSAGPAPAETPAPPTPGPSALPSAGDRDPAPAAPSFFDADILAAPTADSGSSSTDDGSPYDDDLPF